MNLGQGNPEQCCGLPKYVFRNSVKLFSRHWYIMGRYLIDSFQILRASNWITPTVFQGFSLSYAPLFDFPPLFSFSPLSWVGIPRITNSMWKLSWLRQGKCFCWEKVKSLEKGILQCTLLENKEHCLKFNFILVISKYLKNNELKDVVIEWLWRKMWPSLST